MNSDLLLLQTALMRSFASGPKHPGTWSDPSGMEKARARVVKEHGGAGIDVDPRSIMAAVDEFKRTGKADGFRDLKYVCLGVGAVDSHGWCVLADEKLRTKVGELAEGQSTVHRRLRCFQALLSSYFTFPLGAKGTSEESKEGWRSLRSWLAMQRAWLSKSIDSKPPWFESMEQHAELLTNLPCEKFGKALLGGDSAGLRDAMSNLSIPGDSWVIEEAVVAQMKAAALLVAEVFKTELPGLIEIAMGRNGVTVGETLRIRCVAILVTRYAACSARPEQPALRDAATGTLGNPWLRRAQWDAWVRKDGKPDDQAREMVFGWLNRRLITDFFDLLSVDDINDHRRLSYWLRFAPFVEDMWFALGTSAQYRHGEQFTDFRERAKGRLLDLEGTTADNNAFVMRIGAYLAVEFGVSGHAFFLFRWDALRPSVLKALTSGKAREGIWINELENEIMPTLIGLALRNREGIGINELKNATQEQPIKLRHVDSPVALKSWEQKFDDKLAKLIGKELGHRPACVPDLEKLVVQANVQAADLRERGGALWVFTEERTSGLARRLKDLGFGYRSGRGWFKE